MDPAELDPWADIPLSSVASDAHSAVARQVVAESVVLLSNNNNSLPLNLNNTNPTLGWEHKDTSLLPSSVVENTGSDSSRSPEPRVRDARTIRTNTRMIRTIAVIGPSADDSSVQAHTYHGTPTKWVTVLDAVKTVAAANHANVTSAQGCSRTGSDRSGFAAATALAADADAVVFVGGLQASMEEVR